MAGVPVYILALILEAINWATIRWSDFASVFLYGHQPKNLGEYIFASLTTFIFAGLVGVLFAILVKNVFSNEPLFTGWLLSISVWFLSFVTVALYKIPELAENLLKDVIVNFAKATLWGILVVYMFRWLSKKVFKRDYS